jgi:AraC-like DNA-binding protein
MQSNLFRVLVPPEILKRDVECFILNQFSGSEKVEIKVFSNGIPGIVFHNSDGHPAIEGILTQSGRKTSPSSLFVCGAGTESSTMRFVKGSYTVVQVILKPHALKTLFGINALLLKDQAVELNEFAAENLNEQLMNAHGENAQVTLLNNFLISKLKDAETRDALVEESLRLIHKGIGTINVRTLAKCMDISERQFERRFSQMVGLSPSSYIRVKRFNEAMRLIKSGRYNTLTDVAYALNFHDQSHFIREIKSFTGVTPKSLSQRVDDFYHNQAGYSYM